MQKNVFNIAQKATVPVFCGYSVLKNFGTLRWHGSCKWPCKQANRNHAGNCYKSNELMWPRTCTCSPLLFLQNSGCFPLFLTDEGCRLGALGWNLVEFRYSEPKITLLATITQLQPMHEVPFQTPPASDFSFLVALQPQLFDKAEQLDA